MDKVCVIISTYNGSENLARQLDSILSQEAVDITLYIRDDGSTDETINILHEYASKYDNIIVESANNVGWEKSFLLALKHAPTAEYYAFSDQDDIWMKNKLSSGINILKKRTDDKPLLYHCNKISVDKELIPLSHQIRKTPKPLNRQNAMIQEYAQGCSIIMNNMAKDLVTSYLPSKKLAHDFWCGLICYLFGEVVYDDNRLFYHISYGNNASCEGQMLKGWLNRFGKLLSEKEVYYSPYQDLLVGYKNKLSKEDIEFINKIVCYKQSLMNKMFLLCSTKFVRDSILGTLSLKIAILCNKL